MIKPYQLAKIKCVRKQTIYRWIREGRIPKEMVKITEISKSIIMLDDEVLTLLKDYSKK